MLSKSLVHMRGKQIQSGRCLGGHLEPMMWCQPTHLEGEPSTRLATVRDRLVGSSPPPAALSPVIKLGICRPRNKDSWKWEVTIPWALHFLEVRVRTRKTWLLRLADPRMYASQQKNVNCLYPQRISLTSACGKQRDVSHGADAHNRDWTWVHVDCGSKPPMIFLVWPNRTFQTSDCKLDKDLGCHVWNRLRRLIWPDHQWKFDLVRSDVSNVRSEIGFLKRPISEKQGKNRSKPLRSSEVRKSCLLERLDSPRIQTSPQTLQTNIFFLFLFGQTCWHVPAPS